MVNDLLMTWWFLGERSIDLSQAGEAARRLDTQGWEEEFSIVFRYLAFAFYSPHSVLVLIPG